MRLDEDRVTAALRALREETAGAEAPPAVEGAVLAAFRAQKVQPIRRKSAGLWWIATAAAAALVFAGLITVALRKPVAAPAVAGQQRSQVHNPAPVIEPVAETPVVRTAQAMKPRPRRIHPAKKAEAPLETWSDFVPVPYAPPLNAQDGGQVLRVRLPRTTLQQFGIPTPADHVFDRLNAEVMVGQDGVVRAIRFAK